MNKENSPAAIASAAPSWEEEQARFFGVSVEQIPAQEPAIQAPEAVAEALQGLDSFLRLEASGVQHEAPASAKTLRDWAEAVASLRVTPSAAVSAGPDPDGERYRWLRAHHTFHLKRIASYGQKWAEVHIPWVGDPFDDRHATMDAAIDAARATPAPAPTQPQQGTYRAHKWNREGERCLVCGDKDWMGGDCSGPPDATKVAQPQQGSELFDIARKAWEAKDPAQWWSKDGLLAAVTAVRDAVSPGQIVHCLACSEIIAQPQQGTGSGK